MTPFSMPSWPQSDDISSLQSTMPLPQVKDVFSFCILEPPGGKHSTPPLGVRGFPVLLTLRIGFMEC